MWVIVVSEIVAMFEKKPRLVASVTLCVWGRGGQSALRFARLRMEKRHNYVRKVAETAVQMFITNDRPNVAGLVLAGSADFKTELSQSDMFDQVRQLCRRRDVHGVTTFSGKLGNLEFQNCQGNVMEKSGH